MTEGRISQLRHSAEDYGSEYGHDHDVTHAS